MVTALTNVELVAAGLAELEPPAAAPKVNSLLVFFCVRCFYTIVILVCAFGYSFKVLRVLE